MNVILQHEKRSQSLRILWIGAALASLAIIVAALSGSAWLGFLSAAVFIVISIAFLGAISEEISSQWKLPLVRYRMNIYAGLPKEILETPEHPNAIGSLALCTRYQGTYKPAVERLYALLPTVKADDAPVLAPNEMRALLDLLKHERDEFRHALIAALPLIGDRIALQRLERFIADPVSPSALREEAESILPALRKRVALLEDRRLLRAANSVPDHDQLLRPAGNQPDIPVEQLLRSVDNRKYGLKSSPD
jgi:hypothetical protein